jgi:hypothetical protein
MSTGNCGQKAPCGCEDVALTTPAPCPASDGCPTPYPCSEVTPAECVIYTGEPIVCGTDIIVDQNANMAAALASLVGYLCEFISKVETFDVQAGDGITVDETVVGNNTTYTVSTESPLLKKFIYEEILPNGNPGQQITILNTLYASCGLPTPGCPGTTATVPNPIDLQIQGYWFNTDLNYWVEFTHNDKTDTYVDALGNIAILPAFVPTPSDLDQPVRVRINVIG